MEKISEIDEKIAKKHYNCAINLLKEYYKSPLRYEKPFNDYLDDLMDKKYTIRGRVLSEKERVEVEIENLKTKYKKNALTSINDDPTNYIKTIYRLIVETPMTAENLRSHKLLLNEMYCLIDKVPPFLDEVYHVYIAALHFEQQKAEQPKESKQKKMQVVGR